jgi:hypothetical protein
MKTLLTAILILIVASTCSAADITLNWDPSDGAVGYRIYVVIAYDHSESSESIDVGNVLTYQRNGLPDTGLTMFRVSAYNNQGEIICYKTYALYCGEWKTSAVPTGVGIQ